MAGRVSAVINNDQLNKPKNAMQTLTNTYHGTSVSIRSDLSWLQIEELAYRANRGFVRHQSKHDKNIVRLHRRIKNALCGSTGCKCGTVR